MEIVLLRSINECGKFFSLVTWKLRVIRLNCIVFVFSNLRVASVLVAVVLLLNAILVLGSILILSLVFDNYRITFNPRGVTGYLKLDEQVVMRRGAATLLLCQKLGGQLPPCSPASYAPESLNVFRLCAPAVSLIRTQILLL